MSGQAERIDTTDALETALAQGQGSPEARALLEKHSRLIDAQETLARADLRHRGWQIISERVGAVLKALTALAGILLLAGIAGFLWSASRASGMVVDPFSVPSDLERQGLNGAVVAKQLLDKVVALEAATQSARTKSSYEDSFSDTQGVVVPYAGVSLGEMRREMRDWLGSETHLSGEMVRLPGERLAVSFRTTNGLSGRVEGSAREPDKLLDAAALAMFKATQPYRYGVYQNRSGNEAEAVATWEALSRSPDLRERLWALHGLALSADTSAEAKAIYQRALRLRPDFLPAIGNMPNYAFNAGEEEEAFKLRQRSAASYARGQDDYDPRHAATYALESEADLAEMKGDLQGAALMRAEAVDQVAAANIVATRPFSSAAAHAAVHDFAAAKATLLAAGYLDPARREAVEASYGPRLSLEALRAIATGDYPAQAAGLRSWIAAIRTAVSKDNLAPGSVEELVDSVRPALAIALTRAGRWRQAAAVIAPMPASHDDAIRARGLIAAAAGRVAESDALFARAVARTPSLPAAHYAWAEAKMLRRDYQAAIEQARLAHRKGPRWAEPLKLWGDALYAQGKSREAAERYAQAAERAPRWGRLHMRWAAALWAGGDRKQAREKLAMAAGMDFSDRDRARLRRMWKAAAAA